MTEEDTAMQSLSSYGRWAFKSWSSLILWADITAAEARFSKTDGAPSTISQTEVMACQPPESRTQGRDGAGAWAGKCVSLPSPPRQQEIGILDGEIWLWAKLNPI